MARRVLQRLGDTGGRGGGWRVAVAGRMERGSSLEREVRGKWTGRFHLGGNIGESEIKEK